MSTLLAEKVTKGSHTPGPWAVEDPIDSELCIVEANKPVHEWKFIATIYLRQGNDRDEFPHAVSEANARLIAAAPELLALARKYASECIECGGSAEGIRGHGPGPEDEYAEPCEACAHIWAVINKAEGRS